jgi:ribose-phosphate pyrophosphokinase
LRKIRTGDHEVDISVPESAALLEGTPVILDDIASSGRTMARAVEQLLAAGTGSPVCLAIHAVFAEGAHDVIMSAGAARIVTTDTIPHPSNAIGTAAVLAKSLRSFVSSLDLPASGRTRLTPTCSDRNSQ